MPLILVDGYAQYCRTIQQISILSSSGDEVEFILLLHANLFLTNVVFNQITGNCKHCVAVGAIEFQSQDTDKTSQDKTATELTS